MKYIALFVFIFAAALQPNCQSIDLIGFYEINGTSAVASIPGYMIISSGDIIDISDPGNPVLNSNYSFDYAASIIAEEDFAYFGTQMSCDLYIADISNIDFPLHKGYLDFGSDIGHGVFGMDKSGNMLYAAIGASFCSIDVSDKENPVMLDTLFIADGQSRDVRIRDNYAFVAHGKGMKVIDISDPAQMVLKTSIVSGYNAIDLGENTAFLGKSTGGADVFDITDPLTPVPEFTIPNSGGTCWDILYDQEHLYMATNSMGLFLYKIDGDGAIEMATYDTPGGGQNFGVALADSLILLPELITGVAIVQYDSLGTVGIDNPDAREVDVRIFPNRGW